jgi:ADP-ribose pyrophosphatase
MDGEQIQRWTVLNEEDVSPSPWFPLLRHTVQLQNGRVVDDYYLAPLGDVVILVALTPLNEVIIVKQYKHGLGEILLELPGGMRQNGKTLEDSALNELEEEAGIKVTSDRLVPLGKLANNPTKTLQVTYGYLVLDAVIHVPQKLDDTENIHVLILPAKKVFDMVKNGDIWTIDSVGFILKAALMYPDIFGLC